MKDYIYIVNAYGEDDSQANSFGIQEAAVHAIPGCDYTDDLTSEEEVQEVIAEVLSEARGKGIIRRLDKKTGFEFVKDGPEKYFGARLDQLKDMITSLTNEEFVTDADRIDFKLRQLVDEQFGKYVYLVPYDELMTLDSFVRECAGKENKFSLENIILYYY